MTEIRKHVIKGNQFDEVVSLVLLFLVHAKSLLLRVC